MIDIKKYQVEDSILSIPNTILSHFGGSIGDKKINQQLLNSLLGSEQVILFVIDGLGYKQLLEARNTWLSQILKDRRIMTVFPSSTPSALTTFHSGLSPREHGLLEWNMYLWEIHQNIQTIPYIKQGTNEPVSPELPGILLNKQTVYEQLIEISVQANYYIDNAHTESVYTTATSRGSRINGYTSKEDLATKLLTNITHNNKLGVKAYHFVHWAKVDSSGHQFGPTSPEYTASISEISTLIKQSLIDTLRASDIDNVALIITSDHGQINVEEQHTYLLDESTYSLLINDHTEIVLPSGGARSVFLNVKSGNVPVLIEKLRSKLTGKAIVTNTHGDEVKKLFGHYKEHEQFTKRIGNILILPEDNVTIWHDFLGSESYRVKGDHGGLSEDEIYVPLIVEKINPYPIRLKDA